MWRQILSEPVGGHCPDAFQCIRFLEEMRCLWNDLQFLHPRSECAERGAVHLQASCVAAPDDEERRSANVLQMIIGEIRTSPSRHDCPNESRQLRGRDERRGRARTRTEVSNRQGIRVALREKPARHSREAVSKHRDVEAKSARAFIDGLFVRREKIEQQRGEAGFLQLRGDGLIPWALATASASVGEHHYPDRFLRNNEITDQRR